MSGCPRVKLSQVLRLDLNPVPVDAITLYPMVGVLSFGRGLFDREPIENGKTSYRQFYRLKADHVVMSQLFGWEGALALSTEKFADKFLSPQFPTFLCDESRLDRKYLGWVMRRPAFWEDLGSRASGMGGRRRTLNPEALFACEIPLPPLTEQRRIVARVESLTEKIEEVKNLRFQSGGEAQAYLASASLSLFSSLRSRNTVGEVCEVIDPNPSHRYPVYVPNGIPIISSSEFIGDDGIDPTRARQVSVEFYESTLGRYDVGGGDVIFSRKGKVGYARLHPEVKQLAMTHTLCVLKPDRTKVEPRYLLHFARSPIFLEELTGTMNPNVGVPTLGLGVIRGAGIPVVTLTEQRRIVAYLDGLQAKVDTLKQLQADTAAELAALLPSILDKAFKGEL